MNVKITVVLIVSNITVDVIILSGFSAKTDRVCPPGYSA